jgi:16S rRNA (cytidine1402-2'-O)-methyltransferase
MNGKLYLIPSAIADVPAKDILPEHTISILSSFQHFIVENARTARRFLKKCNPSIRIDSLIFYQLNKHTNRNELSGLLKPAKDGNDMGLLSEAGLPCIADPGSEVIQQAHASSIQTIPLVGPSSIFMALMASGLSGQKFAFHGYLPIKQNEQIKKIKHLESVSASEKQSQIFMETPYRNKTLVDNILRTCSDKTLFCIAMDIMHPEKEFIHTTTIENWKKHHLPDLHKRPAIFLLQQP